MASQSSSSKKNLSPCNGFMNLSNWLIKYPKPSESSIQMSTESTEDEDKSKKDLIPVEWYPIQSGYFTVHQSGENSKPVRVKIGNSDLSAKGNITTTDNKPAYSNSNGYFKLGKGQFNHNLAICHSKEKDAIFFKLATCFCKATFNKHFMTMSIKPENHIEDLQKDKKSSNNSGQVTCNVKFALEETAQHFENALRKLACILRSSNNNPRVRIDRIGNIAPIVCVSSLNLNKDDDKDTKQELIENNVEDEMDTTTYLPDIEANSAPSTDTTDNLSCEKTENDIAPAEEAKILLDLFNTFSNPYSRTVIKAIQLYLTGNNNGISQNLAKDVQMLINTRQTDIEKYVEVLRKTNSFKNMK